MIDRLIYREIYRESNRRGGGQGREKERVKVPQSVLIFLSFPLEFSTLSILALSS